MNAIDTVSASNAGSLLALYAARRQSLPGPSAPREAAARRLEARGLPRRSVEAWKYTDLRPLAALDFAAVPAQPDAGRLDSLQQRLAGLTEGLEESGRLVFVGGRFDAALSRLPEGLDIEIGPGSGGLVPGDVLGPAAVNAMLAEDGARIRVDRGRDAGLLLLVQLSDGAQAAEAESAHPRFSVRIEPAGRLCLVEVALGLGLYLNNTVLEAEVREDGHLTHVLLQDEGLEAMHVSTVYAEIGSRAAYDSFTLALGGRLARHEVHARLSGPGGGVHVNGAQLLGGRQHGDLTSVIAHDAPGCLSRQTVKNVLAGSAHGVFQGKIVVARLAQKTDGYQMNQALLLSDRAQIDSKPELEIYADDVKCSHGATAGALDEDQLFYLRSRGVPSASARALLVRAFLQEAFGLIGEPAVEALLERAVETAWDREAR